MAGAVSAASRGVRALVALICTLPCAAHGQRAIDNVVPRPMRVVAFPDAPAFVLRSPIRILVPAASVPWRELGEQLAASIRSRTGYTTTVSTGSANTRGTISLRVADRRTNAEARTTDVHSAEARSADAYSLDVDTLGVRIVGGSITGAWWGAETLLQLHWHSTDDQFRWERADVRVPFGVLDEVMALFPSPVIHVGGDEVPKDRWKACASCQAVMQREKLADEDALQRWFLRRVAAHVATRGRRIIGWDEVLDGPYVAGGIVQSWRDSSFTRAAVVRGHDVIASPSNFTYLNRSPAELTVADVAGFNPMPPGLDSALSPRVLGAEVPFWSEHIVSGANLELMAIPRLLAFADVQWSDAPRDLRDMQRRLSESQLPALRAAGYAVGPSDHGLGAIQLDYDTAARRPMWATHDVPANREGVVVRTLAVDVASRTAVRFIRVSARAGGVLPIGHAGAGPPAWLFADEVIGRARRAEQ